MEDKILIIDGNSLINRAFYAVQRPMITKDGIYTQGVYGFLNMLQKLENDYAPKYLTVAFDMKAPTFRHLEYDGYKAVSYTHLDVFKRQLSYHMTMTNGWSGG